MNTTRSTTLSPSTTADHTSESEHIVNTATTVKSSTDTSNLSPTPGSPATPSTAERPPNQAVTTLRVARGEWTKFWTVRSTSLTLVAAGVATVILGMIFSAVSGTDAQATGPAAFLTDPVEVALGGVGLTAMMIGVLGVMFVASEYSTGLIRTWFAAAGRRRRVIQAKAAVVASSVVGVAAVAVSAAVVAGQAVYAGSEPTVSLFDALDVIVGTTIYLAGIALIGVALGFILRSTAAGIGTLVGAVFIGPNLLQLLPDSITDLFLKYLPSSAGDAMMSQVSNPDLLSTGAAYAVLIAWVFGLLAVASVLVNRRDA